MNLQGQELISYATNFLSVQSDGNVFFTYSASEKGELVITRYSLGPTIVKSPKPIIVNRAGQIISGDEETVKGLIGVIDIVTEEILKRARNC